MSAKSVNTVKAATVNVTPVAEAPITGAQATAVNNVSVASLEVKRRDVAKQYKDGKYIAVTGSPFYRAYFGNNMPIIINGIAIHVPLDGNAYEIPEEFAGVFTERIRRVDKLVKSQKDMSNVNGNFEAYAGEKSLIRSV